MLPYAAFIQLSRSLVVGEHTFANAMEEPAELNSPGHRRARRASATNSAVFSQ